MLTRAERLTAQAWLGSGAQSDDYWAEGELAHIEVEASDANEVRLGVKLDAAMSDDATLYFTRSDAARLSVLLAAASIAEVEVGGGGGQ